MAEVNISDWVNMTITDIDKIVEYTIEGAIDSLDSKSAVGDISLWKTKYPPKNYAPGHFRANWQLGVDSIPNAEIMSVDPTGTSTVTKNKSKIPKTNAAKHDNYYIVNNVPYANMLEYGNHSSQVPAEGMVGKTEIEFSEIVSNAVSRVVK